MLRLYVDQFPGRWQNRFFLIRQEDHQAAKAHRALVRLWVDVKVERKKVQPAEAKTEGAKEALDSFSKASSMSQPVSNSTHEGWTSLFSAGLEASS